MNRNQFVLTLNKYSELNFGNLIELGSWVERDALPWLWEEMSGILPKTVQHPNFPKKTISNKKLKPMLPKDAVRNGLVMSFYDKTQISPPYFHAHITMLDVEAKRYCAQVKRFAQMQPAPYVNATALSLHKPLLNLMFDGLSLLENAAQNVAGVDDYYAAYGKRFEHPIEVLNGARQVIYGIHSGLAHSDLAPSMAIAVLRTAIELRIRHAFCIYHMVSKKRIPSITPIDLNTLFTAIQPYEKNIQFGVDFHDLWKIYKWSNIYLHAGMRDYCWAPGYILHFLLPLFGSLSKSSNGGIQMNKATWRAVRKAVDNAYIPKKGPKKLKMPAYSESEAQCIFK